MGEWTALGRSAGRNSAVLQKYVVSAFDRTGICARLYAGLLRILDGGDEP